MILRASLKVAKKQANSNKERRRTNRCCLWYPDRFAKLYYFHAYGFSRFVCLVTFSSAVVGSPVRHVASRWREFNIFTETAVRVYGSCHHKSGLTLHRCVFSLFHCRRRKQQANNGQDTLHFCWARRFSSEDQADPRRPSPLSLISVLIIICHLRLRSTR
jgi:hypothetical protein